MIYHPIFNKKAILTDSFFYFKARIFQFVSNNNYIYFFYQFLTLNA